MCALAETDVPMLPPCRSAGVRGSDLVPHLNVLDFFRQRQQERQHGGASYGMGYLVKDTLHCFCTSADEEVKATHVPVRRCACCCLGWCPHPG